MIMLHERQMGHHNGHSPTKAGDPKKKLYTLEMLFQTNICTYK